MVNNERILTNILEECQNVIDEILEEPAGGSHRQPLAACDTLKLDLIRHLDDLQKVPNKDLRSNRYEKFRVMGSIIES